MHLQFPPDTTMDQKLELYLSAIRGNIALLIRDFSAKYDPKYLHLLSQIDNGFKLLNKTIVERKNLIGADINLVVNQLDSILGVILKINNDISKSAPLSEFISELNILANNFDINFIKEIKNINYYYTDNLTENDFYFIFNDLVDYGIDIGKFLPKEIYKDSNKNNQILIIKKLIELKNIVFNKNIEHRDLKIQVIIDQLQDITDAYNLKKRTEDTNKTIDQIAENITKENTGGLDEIYKDNAAALDKKINDLNNIILLLFVIIIIFIVVKLGLTLFNYNEFTKIYNLIPFASLIIACSALLTYLIKDRNRLIKLYTHYDMCHRELSTLPEYMRELDSDQRKQMYIDLSTNYFRGGNLNIEASQNNKSEIETLKTSISDLTKLVSEIKGTLK